MAYGVSVEGGGRRERERERERQTERDRERVQELKCTYNFNTPFRENLPLKVVEKQPNQFAHLLNHCMQYATRRAQQLRYASLMNICLFV